MDRATPYLEGKIILAAVLVLEFRDKKNPDVNMISELTTFSVEKVYVIVKTLEDLGAVKRVSGPFEDVIVIQDEAAVNQLEGREYTSNIDNEVADFTDKQKSKIADINNLFGKKDKNKDLRQSLEQQIKAGGKRKKENPLDIFDKAKKEPEKE